MTKNVLFTCVKNSGETQITETFFVNFTSSRFYVFSPETITSSQQNLIVIQVMDKIEMGIPDQIPQFLSDSLIENYLIFLNMWYMPKEFCFSLFIVGIFNWSIIDPEKKLIDKVRIIRNVMKSKVVNLIYFMMGKPNVIF